jgi:hypothetical protein
MSKKFEELVDLVVNEEMDKAHELFHEIVVEKSREIYENLIAEEAEDDVEEGMTDDDVEEGMEDDVEESAEDDVEEGMDDAEFEDAYDMDEGDDDVEPSGLEKTGDFEKEISADEPGSEEDAMSGIKDAIAELEAAFAELEMAKGGEMGSMDDMGDMGDAMPGDDKPEDLKMGFAEGKRMTREYVEKVGNDWDKNSMKSQGQYVGAGTGDKDGAPVEGRSPIASGKNKPGPAGVNAGNLVQGGVEGQSNTGTSPGKVNHGVVKASGEKFDKGQGNVPGGKMGVKNLSKVAGGHGAERKGAGPGPVGSGTGDKAGQTSIDPATSKQFLKPYSK